MDGNKILVCENCGEVLTENTQDLSCMKICRSKICGVAVRRGVLVDRDKYEAERAALAA